MKVGIIGLGQMGYPIAQNILSAGHELTVYNRTAAKARGLVNAGARLAGSPLEAAQTDVLVTMVTDDSALKQIFFEYGLMDSMPMSTIHVTMSTISASCGSHLRDAHAAIGRPFVAAPVLGRPDRAADALLFILCSGPEEHIKRCVPVFEVISQRQFYLGSDPVAAIVAKIANNFLIGCVIESMAEAYTVCDTHGLSRSDFLHVITETIFGAPIYSIYGGMMADHRYLPPACPPAIGIKDMQLALDAAAAGGKDMPLARLVSEHLADAVSRGFAEHDWSVLGSDENKWTFET